MADLANVWVDIKGRWANFERDAQSQLSGIGGRIGKGIGTAVMGGVGVAVAGGAALLKVGDSFDTMGDTIRIGTGATGEALKGLEQTAIGLATSIPTSFADAGSAVADLNTRLGLTGEPLEAVSARMLELSRITGTDLASNIQSGTRVLGDWGVSVEDMPGALDGLFRASQATGIGFDTLSSQLVAYGAPLRQLGFGFETSAALLGKFEKEGVNAELVMGSMRVALGKMARSGEPAEETLGRVVDSIANAGSTSEANAIALELFGARAGPDMAAAIREGRFEVDDLVDTIANGGETILGAAADTNDWRESLQILTNKGMAKLMPLATRVFNGLGTLLERHGPAVERFAGLISDRVAAAFEAMGQMWDRHGATVMAAVATAAGLGSRLLRGLADGFAATFGWLRNNQAALAGVATLIGVGLVAALGAWTIATWAQVAALWAQAAAFIAAHAPLIAIGVALAALVAGVVYAYQNWDWFRSSVDAVASFMRDTLWPILQSVGQFIGRAFVRAVEYGRVAVDALVVAFRATWRWLQQMWDRSAGFRSFLAGAFSVGVGIATRAIELHVALFRTAWRWAKTLWDRSEGLRGFLADVFAVGVDVAKRAIALLWISMQTAWRWAKSLWDRTDGLRGFLAGAFETGISTATTIVDGLATAFNSVKSAVQWLIDNIGRIPTPDLGFLGGAVDFVTGRAIGGPISAGRPYLVGEEGPELLFPNRSGYVATATQTRKMISAASMGASADKGTTTVVVNHHGQTVTPATIAAGIRMARLTT